jgi:hypothetical protein
MPIHQRRIPTPSANGHAAVPPKSQPLTAAESRLQFIAQHFEDCRRCGSSNKKTAAG